MSYAEEIECGRSIAAKGKGPFIDEFLKSTGPAPRPEGRKYSNGQVVISAIIFAMMIGGVFMMENGPRFMKVMGVVLGLYFLSAALSVIRLNFWLNHLVRQYAAHAAKGKM